MTRSFTLATVALAAALSLVTGSACAQAGG